MNDVKADVRQESFR